MKKPQFHVIANELRQQARQAEADAALEAKEYRSLASEVSRTHGTRWRQVNKVSLKEQKAYFVRRLFGPPRGGASEPCFARWTEHGWDALIGFIPSGTSSDTLAVWVE